MCQETSCKSCGSVEVEEGYALPLCKNCRDMLVKRPLPKLIRGFFLVIVCILIFSLIKFPASLASGIAFERGLKAEDEKKYMSALKEYKLVQGKFPESTLVLARLGIAYYHNGMYQEVGSILEKISGKKIPDRIIGRELSNRSVADMNVIIQQMGSLYSVDEELSQILNDSQKEKPEQTLQKLKTYALKDPNNLICTYYLANIFYDLEKYSDAEKEYLKVITLNPGFYSAYLSLAAAYREQGDYDKGIEYCNKVLKYNSESAKAYASLSKIELKRHNDKLGLELALKANNLDADDPSAITNLALAYHFNNMEKERNNMLEMFKQSKYYEEDEFKKLNSVFNGDIEWRK